MSEGFYLPIMYQTGIDRAIDTCRTGLFDLTNPHCAEMPSQACNTYSCKIVLLGY